MAQAHALTEKCCSTVFPPLGKFTPGHTEFAVPPEDSRDSPMCGYDSPRHKNARHHDSIRPSAAKTAVKHSNVKFTCGHTESTVPPESSLASPRRGNDFPRHNNAEYHDSIQPLVAKNAVQHSKYRQKWCNYHHSSIRKYTRAKLYRARRIHSHRLFNPLKRTQSPRFISQLRYGSKACQLHEGEYVTGQLASAQKQPNPHWRPTL